MEELEQRTVLAANWSFEGPKPVIVQEPGNSTEYGGIVNDMAVYGKNGAGNLREFLLATAGGVWRSTDFVNVNGVPPAAGATWTPTMESFKTLLNPVTGLGSGLLDVGALTIDPYGNGLTVYAGTGYTAGSPASMGGSGILVSTNGGQSWTPLAQGTRADPTEFWHLNCTGIVADPRPGLNDTLWASFMLPTGVGAAGGIYKSTDNGRTWAKVFGAVPGANPNNPPTGLGGFPNNDVLAVTDLEYRYDATNRRLVLLAAVVAENLPSIGNPGNSGVWVSTNAGKSWSRVPNNALGFPQPVGQNPGRVVLTAMHPEGGGGANSPMAAAFVYAKPGTKTYSVFVVRSTDGGATWTDTGFRNDLGEQLMRNLAFEMNVDGRIWIAGQNDGFASNTNGSFGASPKQILSPGNAHADHQDFAFYEGIIYDANDGGVWRRRGLDASWNHENSTLGNIRLHAVDSNPEKPDNMIAGTQDAGIVQRINEPPGTMGWKRPVEGDGVAARYGMIGKRGGNKSSVAYGIIYNGWLHANTGSGWVEKRGKDEDLYPFHTKLAVSLDGEWIVMGGNGFVGFASTQTYKFARLENEASPPNPANFTSAVTALAFGDKTPDDKSKQSGVLYAGFESGGKVDRWDQSQGKWTVGGIPDAKDYGVSSLAVVPDDPDKVFATIDAYDSASQGKHVYYSEDGGKKWKNISTNLPKTMRVLSSVYDKVDKAIYIGTDSGVWRATKQSTALGAWWIWKPFGGNMPIQNVTDLTLETTKDKHRWLNAATYGRGAWRLDLSITIAARDDYFGGQAGQQIVVSAPGVMRNDNIPESQEEDTKTVLDSPPANGNVVLFPDGSFTYTPDNSSVTEDFFTYHLKDDDLESNVATVYLRLDGTHYASNYVYEARSYSTLVVDAVEGVLSQSTNPTNAGMTASVVTGPSHGSLTLNPDGSFSYSATPAYVGADGFTYRFTTPNGQSNTGTVTLNLPNDPPTAVADETSVSHDHTLTEDAGWLTWNDEDPDGDPLTAALVTQAAHGTAVVNANGSFTYTPQTGYVGPDSFTYRVFDGVAYSAPATVAIDVTNAAPVSAADYYGVLPGQTTNVPVAGVLANDTDADGDSMTASLVTGASHGTAIVSSNGSFSYTPNFAYTGPDSFTYKANDGQTNGPVTTVTLAVRTGPTAHPEGYTVARNGTLTVENPGLLANDVDPQNDALTVSANTSPAHGTVTVYPNGSFVYTPTPGYIGPDSFTYTVTDGTTTSSPATVNLTVTNSAPAAGADDYAARHDQALLVSSVDGVLWNDADAEADSLTAALVAGPSHGTLVLNLNGSFTYTPAASYLGPDSFTYQVSDGNLTGNTATVTLTVANSAPVAADDTKMRPTNLSPVDVPVLANDTDPDGDSFAITGVGTPNIGTAVVMDNGTPLNPADDYIRYTPSTMSTGETATFTYTVTDSLGATATGTVSVTSPSTAPATLGDYVWEDVNGNGLQDAGEPALPGITVRLRPNVGGILDEVVTDDTGYYQFTVEDPSRYPSYRVSVAPYLTYRPTLGHQGTDPTKDSDVDPALGSADGIILNPDQTRTDVDIGLVRSAVMAGRAWWDQDSDGLQDETEIGWGGVTVRLRDASNTVLFTTQTDDYGEYQFDDLNPGTYSVQLVAPTGAGISPQDQGTDDAMDSDPNPATGVTAAILLSSGELNWTTDGGLTSAVGPPPPPSLVGERVWADANANGLQDPGEPGVANVAVELLNTGGSVVASTTTDAGGAYQFPTVPAGTYRVRFALPTGYQFTLPFQGADDDVDSNVTDFATGRTDPFTITAGTSALGIDAGLLPGGTATVGDRVWVDMNENGIQDLGEPGKAGVAIELRTVGTGSLVASTTSGASGAYALPNVPAGRYYLKFTGPSGYVLTTQHAGWPTEDSDPYPGSGETPAFAVAGGYNDNTRDAGLIGTDHILGGHVWYDTNEDGIRDLDEPGADGEVQVQLLDATGVVLQTATPALGTYFHFNVAAGTYRIRFLIPTENGFTAANQGTDELLDSDVTSGNTTELFTFDGGFDETWNAGLTGEQPGP